jgi:hypothetical protein
MGPPGPVKVGMALSITEFKEDIPGGYQTGVSTLSGDMMHNDLHLDHATTTLVATVGTNDPSVPAAAFFPPTTCQFNVTVTNTGTPTKITFVPTGSFPTGVEVIPDTFDILGAPGEGKLSATPVTVKFKVGAMADLVKNQPLSLVCRSTTIWDNILSDAVGVNLTTQPSCRGFALAPYCPLPPESQRRPHRDHQRPRAPASSRPFPQPSPMPISVMSNCTRARVGKGLPHIR